MEQAVSYFDFSFPDKHGNYMPLYIYNSIHQIKQNNLHRNIEELGVKGS